MRPFVLVPFVVVLSVASVASITACSSSPDRPAANGDAAAPLASPDGGARPAPPPSGMGSLGGIVARPSKDAGADTGVMPDPTPGLVPTCKGAALCIGECPEGDDACFEACMKDMPDDELAKLVELAGCVDKSGCEDDVCFEATCGDALRACLGE